MSKGVTVIGCGTIGRAIIDAVMNGRVSNAEIKGIVDIDSNAIRYFSSSLGSNKTFMSCKNFFDSPIINETDIIVEAATQNAVLEYGKRILESKKDLMIMS